MLEVRQHKGYKIIFEELDEVTEIFFVIEGTYAAGFELNNQKFFKYKYFSKSIIGGFNVIAHVRSQFVFKTITKLKSFALRKTSWQILRNLNSNFTQQMSIHMINNYYHQVFEPLLILKQEQMDIFASRLDYHTVMMNRIDKKDFMLHFEKLQQESNQEIAKQELMKEIKDQATLCEAKMDDINKTIQGLLEKGEDIVDRLLREKRREIFSDGSQDFSHNSFNI